MTQIQATCQKIIYHCSGCGYDMKKEGTFGEYHHYVGGSCEYCGEPDPNGGTTVPPETDSPATESTETEPPATEPLETDSPATDPPPEPEPEPDPQPEEGGDSVGGETT